MRADNSRMAMNPSAREALLHVVKNLPAAPAILAQLGRMLLAADADIADAVELLKRDPALTARIIRLANSVIFGAGARFGSLEEALARVGFNEVYRLTGLAVLSDVTRQQLPLYRLTAGRLRENAVLTALIMERLAAEAGVEPATAYTVGLLRPVGRIAFDRIAPAALQREPYSVEQHGPVGEWERQHFGMTNGGATALALENWRFPLASVIAIRSHYLPGGAGGQLASLLNLAAGAAELAGHGLPGEQTYWTRTPEKLDAARVDDAAVTEAMRGALETFGPIRGAVG